MKKQIAKKYWITWGISSLIGIMMFNISLSGPHLCSPVVGCGPEVPMLIAITISLILILFRVFKKNKLKLITPLILIFTLTPSLIIFLKNTIWRNTLLINGNHNDSFCLVSISSRINYSCSYEFLCCHADALDFYYGWNLGRWEWTTSLLWKNWNWSWELLYEGMKHRRLNESNLDLCS